MSDKEKSADKRFENDPEAKFRIYSVLSYIVVLFVIGVPVWWHTTRVYRATLPLDEMFNVRFPSKMIRESSIPLSLEYDILITLVNPDPVNLRLDIDQKNLVGEMKPFVKALEPVASFTLKSQWLYLTDLGVVPKNKGGQLYLMKDQLPHVITPLEKKISSHMSPRPVLNLVVYFSPCGSPLYLHGRRKGKIQSFLSPRWGGVSIINPNCTGVFKPEIKPIVTKFKSHLKELIGLKKDKFDKMRMIKIHEMLGSARRTLKSLAQLLSEISSIVISDEVASKIEIALSEANTAQKLLHEGRLDEALKSAKVSFAHSEEAFSDPSLLALLYFPDDQKYAVYIPLFLPIMIPVSMSLLSVQKWFMSKPKTN